MTGVTDLYNNGSLADTTYTGLKAIPNVWLTGTSADTTLGYAAAAATAGTADEQTVKLNGAAASSSATITTNGIESITVDREWHSFWRDHSSSYPNKRQPKVCHYHW